MIKFKDIKVAPKILATAALLGMVTVGVAVLGAWATQTLFRGVVAVDEAGERSMNAGRATANMLSFVRAVERLPLDLAAGQRDLNEKHAEDESRRFDTRLAKLDTQIQVLEERRSLDTVRARHADYQRAYQTIKALAREGKFDDARREATRVTTVVDEMRAGLREIEGTSEKFANHQVATVRSLHERTELLLILIPAAGLVLGIGLATAVIVFGVTRPITAMTAAMSRLADGDHGVTIPAVGQRDEVGLMAQAVLVFKENMIKAKDAAAREAAEQQARAARAEALDRLAQGFDADVTSVLKMVTTATTEMQATATSMTATAEESSRQAAAVAAAAEQASHNVQTVASAAEELSASVGEIGRQVETSAKISAQAVSQASRTNAQVESLTTAAQKIGDVIKIIYDIAGQTNLLALNATIVAARAGDAGKGFAVVASEVKSLANQTAKATEEIAAHITAIQSATQDSVTAIQEIGKTIAEINQIASAIASAVEEQGAATQEIARNVQEAAKGTTEVTSNVSGVNQAAADTGAAATQVLSAASELSKQSEMLRGKVELFLADVKTA
jgi:methyl-accepting chemotaxis protein